MVECCQGKLLADYADCPTPESRICAYHFAMLQVHRGLTQLFAKHKGPFDIVFCDIDKQGYPDVPALALPRLRKGGLLIFDNTLWFGRVVDEPPQDADTAAIKRLNADLGGRADVVTSIVPLRDGVSVSIKL